MGIAEAILYGVVQGLTEFLPISSTAHLRLVPEVLKQPDPGAGFTAVIQIGTLLAVLIYFRTDLWRAFRAWAMSLVGRLPSEDKQHGTLGWAVLVGTIPIVIAGVLLEDRIKGSFRSLQVVATMLILMGVVLFIADRVGKRERLQRDVRVIDGLWIGLWQAVALVPGASRSGSTISGALFAGFDRAAAARISFLLSVPSILAAGLKELYDERKLILGAQLTPTLVATVVSFVVGYASIAFLIKFLQTRSTLVFVIYRVALGILLFALIGAGILK